MRCGTVGVFNHESPRLAEINIERMKHIKPGGNWTDIPLDLLPKGMKKPDVPIIRNGMAG